MVVEPFAVAVEGVEAARPATAISLVPTMLARLLDAGADLARFQAILVGGAPTPPGLLERARAAGAPVTVTYGMTETCGGCVYNGVPLDEVRASVREDGRIALRGPVLFDGYRALYHEGHEVEEGKSADELAPIPELATGDRVTVRQVTPSQHFTEPPPRYSEASLVKKLEELGIGRPSTYAAIISTLRERWYATAKDRRFAPTPQGEMVWKVMQRCFPEVFEVGFTAQMETELDKVEEGDLGWRQVLQDFWGPFEKQLAAVDVEAIIHQVHDLSNLAKERCPECGSRLVVKSGRFGPYLACENYPEKCTYSRSLRNKVPDRPTDLTCPKCGAPLVIKTGRYGEFLACTQYPKCKHTQPVPLGIKCPKCGEGDIAERRTRKGRNFWGCLRYPECDYSTWNQPVAVACPACGFVGMEQRQTKTSGVTRKCMKCGHEIQVEEPATAETAAG